MTVCYVFWLSFKLKVIVKLQMTCMNVHITAVAYRYTAVMAHIYYTHHHEICCVKTCCYSFCVHYDLITQYCHKEDSASCSSPLRIEPRVTCCCGTVFQYEVYIFSMLFFFFAIKISGNKVVSLSCYLSNSLTPQINP